MITLLMLFPTDEEVYACACSVSFFLKRHVTIASDFDGSFG